MLVACFLEFTIMFRPIADEIQPVHGFRVNGDDNSFWARFSTIRAS